MKWILTNSIFYRLYEYIKSLILHTSVRKNILIATNVRIYNSKLSNDNYLYRGVILSNCYVGGYTYIRENTKISNTKIGKFCSIAQNVTINPGKHEISNFSTHPSTYSFTNRPIGVTFSSRDYYEEFEMCEIGNDVWIGTNVTIMPGVKISDGAVIASGSVVTKNIEPYQIVGGVPAKHIKYRFENNKIKELLDLEWWNKDKKWLKKFIVKNYG